MPYQIDFQPLGRRGKTPKNRLIVDSAIEFGVELVNICGGTGTCGRCKVQILAGTASKPTSTERETLSGEELDRGFRLACQTYALSDLKCRVPPESLTAPQRTQTEGLEVSITPDPVLSSYAVELEPPTLKNQQADADRLIEVLEKQSRAGKIVIDREVLAEISPKLREWGWKATVTLRDREIISMASEPSRRLGLAVDLGTTKIAAYLIDLDTGQVPAFKGIMNPQIAYGEDVIARMARTWGAPRDALRLREIVITALNDLADELCAETDFNRSQILETVLVGNTAMHHLFLGLPVAQLAAAPYIPAVQKALDVKARDLGLKLAPGSYIHLLPNIAGFVGADHVAALLATGVLESEGITLVMDIGTNTEVCLAGPGFMTSVSCASGPAFEGAHIKHGMRAANGSIEHLRLTGGRVEYQTIGGIPPVGLCGSGILDALAQLYETEVLDTSGRMMDHPRVRSEDGKREYVLIGEDEREGRPALTITQKDVRQLQLAKAAMQTGIRVLLENHSLSAEDIDRVLVAGAFGSYIDIESAMTVGLLPKLPPGRFRQVGNAAGIGARLALISGTERDRAQEIARRTGYIEMASLPRFQAIFTEALSLGPFK
jgi:uncharacterized 2Fe-2S/4Fe-4S cluster protein (DUF4445 family)